MAGLYYVAPADLFSALCTYGLAPFRRPRFATADEVIRFAIEQMPPEFLDGAILEIENRRVDGAWTVLLDGREGHPVV